MTIKALRLWVLRHVCIEMFWNSWQFWGDLGGLLRVERHWFEFIGHHNSNEEDKVHGISVVKSGFSGSSIGRTVTKIDFMAFLGKKLVRICEEKLHLIASNWSCANRVVSPSGMQSLCMQSAWYRIQLRLLVRRECDTCCESFICHHHLLVLRDIPNKSNWSPRAKCNGKSPDDHWGSVSQKHGKRGARSPKEPQIQHF